MRQSLIEYAQEKNYNTRLVSSELFFVITKRNRSAPTSYSSWVRNELSWTHGRAKTTRVRVSHAFSNPEPVRRAVEKKKSPGIYIFNTIAQVIIEKHELWLVEDYVISCYNLPAWGDYNTEALIFKLYPARFFMFLEKRKKKMRLLW